MNESVFSQLYDEDPKKAAILAAKSELVIAIENLIKLSGLNNTEVAEHLGVPRSRISELMNGRIDKISLDALTAWLSILSKGQLKVSAVESAQGKVYEPEPMTVTG
jgi:predicted XRE-type DNA-binding protein